MALGLQRLFASKHPFQAIGDENEYLERSQRADPFDPSPFIRMPLMIAISVLLGGHQRRVAQAMSMASATCVAITAAVGASAHGLWIAAPLALWLVLPERVALGNRIWPESFLSSLAVLLAGILVLQPPYASALIGTVCALAVATRIDAIIWAPLAGIASTATASLTATDWTVLMGPMITVLMVMSVRNWLRYRILLPETTFLFNLLVMAKESDTANQPLSELLTQTLSAWRREGTSDQRARLAIRSVAGLLRNPVGLIVGFGRRLLSLFGRDTFVSEVVLQDRGLSPWLRWLLPFGASMLLGSAFASVVWLGPSHFWYALPTGGAALVAAAVHTRTRFRQPLMPVAVLVLADAGSRTITLSTTPSPSMVALLLVCAAGTALAVLGSRLAARRERQTRSS